MITNVSNRTRMATTPAYRTFCFRDLQRTVERQHGELEQAAKRVAELHKELNGLRHQSAQDRSRIASLEESLAATSTAHAEAAALADANAAEAKRAQKDARECRATAVALESSLAEARARVSVLLDQLEDARAEVAVARHDSSDLRQACAYREAQLNGADRAQHELCRQLAVTEGALVATRVDLTSERSAHLEAVAERHEYREELSRRDEELSEEKDGHSATLAELRRIERRCGDVEVRSEEFEAEARRQARGCCAAEARACTLEAKAVAMAEEESKLAAELRERTQELRRAERSAADHAKRAETFSVRMGYYRSALRSPALRSGVRSGLAPRTLGLGGAQDGGCGREQRLQAQQKEAFERPELGFRSTLHEGTAGVPSAWEQTYEL